MNKNHFKFIYVIGKGGFGRVWKVEMRKNRKLLAMKEMSKAKYLFCYIKDHLKKVS